MTVYTLKPRFQRALRPLASALCRQGVTANQVTLAAAIGSVAVGAVTAWRADNRTVFLIVPIWMVARMALNAVDGMLARDFGQKSALGGYLNEIGDVVSDVAVYAPFALVPPFTAVSLASVIVASVSSELAGALGPMVGASRRYDGPMGKSDRAAVFGALAVVIGFTRRLPQWLAWWMPVLTLLIVATLVNRVRAGIGDVRRSAAAGGAAAAKRPTRTVSEKTFRTHDGVELFYRYWAPVSGIARGAIVLFHRGHEHSGRIAHLAEELGLPDFAIFAWDARGNGRSPGPRGFSPSLGTPSATSRPSSTTSSRRTASRPRTSRW